MKKIFETICAGSLLLAVMGCERGDGSPAFGWIITMLSICAVSGIILKIMEKKSRK